MAETMCLDLHTKYHPTLAMVITVLITMVMTTVITMVITIWL